MVAAARRSAQQQRANEHAGQGRVDEAPGPPEEAAGLPEHGDGGSADPSFAVLSRIGEDGQCCLFVLPHGRQWA